MSIERREEAKPPKANSDKVNRTKRVVLICAVVVVVLIAVGFIFMKCCKKSESKPGTKKYEATRKDH